LGVGVGVGVGVGTELHFNQKRNCLISPTLLFLHIKKT